MKRDDKILQERLARIAEFQRAGGKLGAVSTALAQFLLGVGRTRIHQLVKAGVLESFGTGGILIDLVREAIGPFKLENALTLDEAVDLASINDPLPPP